MREIIWMDSCNVDGGIIAAKVMLAPIYVDLKQ